MWQFLFLEMVPRETVLKAGSSPRQGSQWHVAIPQTQSHPTADSESTHQGVSGKASGPRIVAGTQVELPKDMALRGQHREPRQVLACEECQPCDFAVTPWPCDKAVSCDGGQPVSSGTAAGS